MKSTTVNIIIWVVVTAILVTLLACGLFNGPSQYAYQLRMTYFPTFANGADDFLIYAPLVVWFFLFICGTKGESSSKWHVFLKGACAFALMWIIVGVLKSITGEMRPDGSNMFSFPSGHTASAFAASTLLYKEFGYKLKWTAIVIYIPAVVVGCMRMLNNRHWLNDVLAGALIGIVSVLLIYYWAAVVYPRFRKDRPRENAS